MQAGVAICFAYETVCASVEAFQPASIPLWQIVAITMQELCSSLIAASQYM